MWKVFCWCIVFSCICGAMVYTIVNGGYLGFKIIIELKIFVEQMGHVGQ